jgi:methylthioribose-1-phosphate isomerase
MWVRGAPLIGATAAYGMAEEMRRDPSDAALERSLGVLHDTRPTAINLRWALDRCARCCSRLPEADRAAAAMKLAAEICDEDVEINRMIGVHGLEIIGRSPRKAGRRAGAHPDPLQCRLAGDRGLGHGHLADVSRGQCGHSDPCLGR